MTEQKSSTQLLQIVCIPFAFDIDEQGNIICTPESVPSLFQFEHCEVITWSGISGGNPDIAMYGTREQFDVFMDSYFVEGLESEKADFIECLHEYSEENFRLEIQAYVETFKLKLETGVTVQSLNK